jgi:tripartite-type tricarboxylate transporter receptor subunit TctC
VDQVTRRIAQKLTEQTGQSFFVENKAGATGTIGAAQVARPATATR